MKKKHGNRKYHEGQVVGPYTVLYYSKPGHIRCKCNVCGHTSDVDSTNIKKNKMCVSCKKHRKGTPHKDLTGMRFGRLTVVEYSGDGKWLCSCDCGNETTVQTSHLNSGHTQSCGCYMRDRTSEANSHNLTGKRFERLVVVEKTDGYEVNERLTLTEYLCKCDCGNYIAVLASNLVSGNTKSCGCIGSSYGEYKVEKLLNENSINYIKEYTYKDLKSSNGNLLRFDFALMNESDDVVCLIEFNGEQHYYAIKRKTNFGKQQREETDRKKVKFCQEREIPLFIIRYDDDILSKMQEIITFYKTLV